MLVAARASPQIDQMANPTPPNDDASTAERPLSEQLASELDRRLRALDAGQEQPMAWETVRQRILDGTLAPPIAAMRGFLRGIDPSVPRDPDRV